MKYLRVRNWEKFQHYKNRNPPWIRLHRTLLRDHEFHLLTEMQQWQLVRLWLLASECENHIAWDEPWIRRTISSVKKVDIEALLSAGFLEESDCKSLPPGKHEASDVLADRKQSADSEVFSTDNSEQFTPPAAKTLCPDCNISLVTGLHAQDCRYRLKSIA